MSIYLSNVDDKNIYPPLSEALSLGELILFAGSGLSAQASSPDGEHPPLWQPLLRSMTEWCIKKRLLDKPEAKEIKNLINKGYLIDAGQELQEILDEPSILHTCIVEVILHGKAESGDAHKLITQLPFRGYITTNYDELIEGEFISQKKTPLIKYYQPTLEGVLDRYRNKEQFIVKLHGDINDPQSIILGNRSYEKLLYSNFNYRHCLENLFSVCSILFIGFSGSDPDIEGIISRVAAFDGRVKRHYMLVPEGSIPNLKAKRFWKDKGINIIEYPLDKSHSGLVKFLNQLSKTWKLDTQHSYKTKNGANIGRKRQTKGKLR